MTTTAKTVEHADCEFCENKLPASVCDEISKLCTNDYSLGPGDVYEGQDFDEDLYDRLKTLWLAGHAAGVASRDEMCANLKRALQFSVSATHQYLNAFSPQDRAFWKKELARLNEIHGAYLDSLEAE